ncbi:PTS fructose transporter subunit IIA [Wenzhouxiangella sp. AB-CW3]|uniref:PTS sugar transporter subunit IIA n=1 Tax=Wenzhouxiangella sp. AB-CW3 TaxID=2771012 RepID=UPI00168B7055|nr:PTS fructose transporter subunit IIA [Wenzhouxiangella sp. AB-CW3]QOC21887.1 PTS fructose transporter subunit IIA [Wenzhouxiangella sp. AB-CW3]
MTGLVLVTHNGLGEALRHEAEHILGQSFGMTTVAISYRADPDTTLDELRLVLSASADAEGALVLTDLPGATPHNLATQAAAELGIPVVSGLNLPMLLKVLNLLDEPAGALAAHACEGGRKGVIRS